MTQYSETADIRIFLQSELVRRCKVNPKYSLRAFARLLEVESSALSKMLSGKRTISRSMLGKIAQKLALSPSRMQTFESSLVERRGRRTAAKRRTAPDYQQMALDHFQVVSDWYHFAILELISVEGFEPNVSWIARSLRISLAEAQAAIERLLRVGFLEIATSGRWTDRAGNVTNISPGFTSAAARKAQEQGLLMAIRALEEVAIGARDMTSMTMAIDSSLLPKAKERVAEFRRGLCEFLQSGKKKDAVYQMNLALYPLTPNFKKTKRGSK